VLETILRPTCDAISADIHPSSTYAHVITAIQYRKGVIHTVTVSNTDCKTDISRRHVARQVQQRSYNLQDQEKRRGRDCGRLCYQGQVDAGGSCLCGGPCHDCCARPSQASCYLRLHRCVSIAKRQVCHYGCCRLVGLSVVSQRRFEPRVQCRTCCCAENIYVVRATVSTTFCLIAMSLHMRYFCFNPCALYIVLHDVYTTSMFCTPPTIASLLHALDPPKRDGCLDVPLRFAHRHQRQPGAPPLAPAPQG
jgi:hypothetical protein